MSPEATARAAFAASVRPVAPLMPETTPTTLPCVLSQTDRPFAFPAKLLATVSVAELVEPAAVAVVAI